MNSEIALIEHCLSGMAHDWRVLEDKYGPLVKDLCRANGIWGADADDVYQETWYSVWRKLETLRRPGSLVAWIRAIARNHIRILIRSKRSDREDLRSLGMTTRQGTDRPEPGPERIAAAEILWNAVLELPHNRKFIIVERYLKPRKRSYRRIARELGLSVGSIGPLQQRALEQLRGILTRDHPGDAAFWQWSLLPLAESISGTPTPPRTAPTALPATRALVASLALIGLLGAGFFLFGPDTHAPSRDLAGNSARRLDTPTAAPSPSSTGIDAPTSRRETAVSSTVPARATTATLNGSVLYEGTTDPAPDVDVEVTLVRSSQREVRRISVESHGVFALTLDEPFEVLQVQARPGPQSTIATKWPRATIALGESLMVILNVTRGSTVEGQVLDEVGIPVAGADVLAWCLKARSLDVRDRPEPHRRAVTDRHGRFSIPCLGPEFTLTAEAPGLTCTGWLTGVLQQAGVVQDLDLPLARSVPVSGYVSDPRGSPLSDVLVRAIPQFFENPVRESIFRTRPRRIEVFTDGQGRFRLSLCPLAYMIDVDVPGLVPWKRPYQPSLEPLAIELESGCCLTGRIVDLTEAPVPSARVRFDHRPNTRPRMVRSDENGLFRFDGLPPSTNGILLVQAANHAMWVQQPLALHLGEPQQIDVVLEPEHRLSGTVVDPNMEPIAGVLITIEGDRIIDHGELQINPAPTWERTLRLNEATTDKSGRFTFRQLYPGPFQLVASDHPGTIATCTIASGTDNLLLVLGTDNPASASVHGEVRDALTGKPVTHFAVRIAGPVGPFPHVNPALPLSNPQGRFWLAGLQPGPQTLIVTSPGYALWYASEQLFAGSTRSLDVPLTPARTVEFHVVDPTRTPVEGCELEFLDVDGNQVYVRRSADIWQKTSHPSRLGRVRVSGLPLGHIDVLVSAPGRSAPSQIQVDLAGSLANPYLLVVPPR